MKTHIRSGIMCQVLVAVFLFIGKPTHAQNDIDNHRKYWYYRSRLTNDFMKVGTGAGESIPFMNRGSGGTSLSNPLTDITTGDASGLLGYYIAVLATEYRLLKINNQNTDKVKHELYCALSALNRIDYKAETVYPMSSSGVLNGFHIRDDIPKTFIKDNYAHFNYYSNWDGSSYQTNGSGLPVNCGTDRGFMSQNSTGMFKTATTWSGWVDDNDHSSSTAFISQDQVYNILLGLAFVHKFVPSYETDGSNVILYSNNETRLEVEAENIAVRIIDNIRNPTNLSGNDCLSASDKLVNSWRLRQPGSCGLVGAGDDARPFAYPLAEAECRLTHNNLNVPTTFNLTGIPLACGSNGYHNAYSIASYPVWQTGAATTQLYNPSHPENGMDTRTMITNISAVCDCVYQRIEDSVVQTVINELTQEPKLNWLGRVIGWIWKLVSVVKNTLVPGMHTNTTASAITLNAYTPLAPLDHGPIAHAVLHDKLTYIPNSQYSMQYLIDVMPCDNIYNFGPNGKSHYEWSSDLRLDHPNRRGSDAQTASWTANRGEYNGIDYMLYHNLYYLQKSMLGVINQNIADLSDVYINQPTNINTGNINSYETITIENTGLSLSSPTYWRAGKSIDFKPGTVITGNNSLHAYVDRFTCATNTGQFRNGEGAESNKDSYPEATYHYQSYPADPQIAPAPAKDDHFKNLIVQLPTKNKSINETIESGSSISILPTITNDKVNAYFKIKNKEVGLINVVDMTGKLIYSKANIQNSDSGMSIDLSEHPQGIYILKFTTTGGSETRQKIVKE